MKYICSENHKISEIIEAMFYLSDELTNAKDEDVDWESINNIINYINNPIECNDCIHSIDMFCELTGNPTGVVCDDFELDSCLAEIKEN